MLGEWHVFQQVAAPPPPPPHWRGLWVANQISPFGRLCLAACNMSGALHDNAVHPQDDDEANVLPEADVTMVTKSIAASWEILQQDAAALLPPFLQKSGLHFISRQ